PSGLDPDVESVPEHVARSSGVVRAGLLELVAATVVRDRKVDATLIQIENDPDELVVKAVPVKVEEEKPAEAAVPAEGEAVAEGEVAEGAAPAAGAEGAKPAVAGAKPAAPGAKPAAAEAAKGGAPKAPAGGAPKKS